MMDFDKLPKGMKIPKPVDIEGIEKSNALTHVELNYSKLIREALDSIKELDVTVESLRIEEVYGNDPIVTLELVVKTRG